MTITRKLNKIMRRKSAASSPVQSDVSQQNASWIVAFLVLLLAIIVIGMSSMNGVLMTWHEQLSHKMRIELPNPKPVAVAQVMTLLQQTAGVERAQIYHSPGRNTIEDQWELIAHLPAIIDVDLASATPFDMNAFVSQLEQVASQSRIETYGQWQEKIGQLAFFLETLGLIVILLIGLAVLITISLVTRSGLVIHRDVIDTLQLMGATSTYIAHQFEIQAFRLSLKGGVIGLMAIIPFLYLLSFVAQLWQLPEVASLLPSRVVLVAVLAMPLLVALLSRMVARLAVLRTLATLD
jgi:cell division protein FtsX